MSLKMSSLDWRMQSVFEGNTVYRESVMFIDPTDEKTLLYPIDEILSLTSYDGKTIYAEGKDYAVRDGRLTLTVGTSIPCITAERYYGGDNPYLQTEQNGTYVNTYYGDMAKWQLLVTYHHRAQWQGFRQPAYADVFAPLLQKLEAGRDVTFLFYGDSITTGGDSSRFHNVLPYEPGFAVLFTEAVAKLYGYSVRCVKPEAEGTVEQVFYETHFGDRGTITYINSAVGGWRSQNGIESLPTHVLPYVREYGCDLYVNGFGMNGGSLEPELAVSHAQQTVQTVRSLAPDACFLLIATMLPNPLATNRWYVNQYRQEPLFLDAAEQLRQAGVPCAVAQMTSVSRATLERKDFRDQSGNNINHPNDFFYRVYAQTLLQTVVGYDKLSTDQ